MIQLCKAQMTEKSTLLVEKSQEKPKKRCSKEESD